MSAVVHPLFTPLFSNEIQKLVTLHHTIYPRIPPRDIFFESLVERAFLETGWPAHSIELTSPNSPQHDMQVGSRRLSIKTETGKGTKVGKITITKLCTTETGDWTSVALIQHALNHLDRYDDLLMLRAIWRAHAFHYQLLDIPLPLLRRLANLTVNVVGRRRGRSSMGAEVLDAEGRVFRLHFDGADGKCQIHELRVDLCNLLLEWDQPR
jgi:hypothetical protein